MKYLLALIACLPFTSHATCYTVYNKTEQVIFQSENPPVDMTQTSIAQELQSKFGPDAVMIFNGNPNCTEILSADANKTKFIDQVPEMKEGKTSVNSSASADTKTIHTGKRGGQYYINENGNKQYINSNKPNR